jgi:hypothetical protein
MTLALKRRVLQELGGNWPFPIKSPESRLKPQLVYALDKDTDVMAENLAQNLVDLSSRCLSPNRTTELSLNHRESGLHIRPLVVVSQERFPIEVVEVPHSVPQAVIGSCRASHSPSIALERNVGYPAYRLDGVKVLTAGIGFVRRHLVDVECLGGLVQQGDKLGRIARLVRRCLNTGNNMGLYPTDEVGLNPRLPLAVAVFVVVPPVIDAGGKTRGVNGEVRLDRSQRGGTLLNQAFEKRCQFGILKVAESAGERRRLGDQPSGFRSPQVGHKASAGHSAIDLISNPKHHVSQRQSRTPKFVFWLGYAVTEVSEQSDKMLLLMGLCLIIRSPLLSAGHLDRLGVGGSAVRLGLSLNYELYRMNVLAGQSSLLKVGAGAKRLVVVEANEVAPIARLGRDFPTQPVLFNLARVRYHQSFCFSLVHFNSPYFNPLFCIYNSTHCVSLSILFGGILMNFLKIVFLNHIDNATHCVVYSHQMNNDEVQAKLAELQQKGWTLANIARRIGQAKRTVESWNQGQRSPANLQSVLASLDKLDKVKRIPKKKIYIK